MAFVSLVVDNERHGVGRHLAVIELFDEGLHVCVLVLALVVLIVGVVVLVVIARVDALRMRDGRLVGASLNFDTFFEALAARVLRPKEPNHGVDPPHVLQTALREGAKRVDAVVLCYEASFRVGSKGKG